MKKVLAAVATGILVFATAGSAVVIDTVPVGHPGNAVDTRYRYETPGFGRVNYTYNIGKYEVTAGQYTEFLNKVAKIDTYGLYNTDMSRTDLGSGITRSGSSGNYSYSVASDFANRPVNLVSWGDSARFANWLHNGQPTGAQNLSTTEDGSYYLNGATSNSAVLAVTRKPNATWVIPSEDEWYKAAYHKNDGVTGNYFDFPTGSNTPPGRDMTDASGNNANYDTTGYGLPIDSGKYTTVVGEFQNSDSPYGTFDQGGNVWELNEAILSGSYRGARGGSFLSHGLDSGRYLIAGDRGHVDPSYELAELGFRVSEVPEPASMAVLALGGIAMIRRKRR